MSSPPSSPEAAALPSSSFGRVVAEIDAEAKRRRADGEFPDGLLAALDGELLSHAPLSHRNSDVESAVRAIEAVSFVNIDAPVESSRSAFRYLKVAIKKLTAWYQLHLARQIMILGLTVARPIRALAGQVHDIDVRVSRLEDTGAAYPAPMLAERAGGTLGDDGAALVVPHLGTTARRVLVGHDDGPLADALRAGGFDAYACSPRHDPLSDDDQLAEDVSEHLATLDERTLGGVVIVGQEGLRTPSGARHLCELAVSRVVRNGRVVVLASDPARWHDAVGPVVADLAVGPAFHAETWAHLLTAAGATVDDVASDGSTAVVVAHRRS